MPKIKCRLCGGRLVNNRCTFCGLDNSVYDRDHSYRSTLAQQKREEKQAEQAHARPKSRAVQTGQMQTVRTAAPKQAPVQPAAPRASGGIPQSTYRRTAPASSGGKKRGCVTWIIVAVVILFALVPALGEIGSSLIDRISTAFSDSGSYSDSDFSWSEEEYTFEDYDPYAYVTREIPDTGETYETVLGCGVYQVGVHIPEGVYLAVLADGAGSITITDNENYIYNTVYFSTNEDYGDVLEQGDIRLYNGAELKVDNGALILFSTSNAQPLTQEPSANPLTEAVVLPVGNYTSDADVPEGIYDISVEDEADGISGYANVILEFPNGDTEYYWADGPQGSATDGNVSSAGVKNVIIPSGTKITVEYGDITLTPSEGYFEVDYSDYPRE